MAANNIGKHASNFQDITGQSFGRLTVIDFHGKTDRRVTLWKCRCDCGKELVVRGRALKTGNTKSCGCLKREVNQQHGRTINKTHGMKDTPTYMSWRAMLQRCYRKGCNGYKNYGGRGITVCDRWRRFEAFLRDMGERPSIKHSLERMDSNIGYVPGNCRWADGIEQANNRRTNHRILLNGESKTISEWSRITGIEKNTLRHRILRGWPAEKTLLTPVR